jgi:hypothetical protein
MAMTHPGWSPAVKGTDLPHPGGTTGYRSCSLLFSTITLDTLIGTSQFEQSIRTFRHVGVAWLCPAPPSPPNFRQ